MEEDLTEVKTVADAKMAAWQWARASTYDPRRARAFAEEWFEKTPPDQRVRSHLAWMLAGFEQHRHRKEQTWSRAWDVYLHETSQWNIETVRHLALFNAAGIAGTATLLAVSSFTDEALVRYSLIAFAVGMVCAIFTLWSNAQGYQRHSEIADEQRRKIRDAATWAASSDADSDYLKKRPKALRWHLAAEILGWTSAALGIVGAGLLAATLL